jgi:hypothetical protein
MQTIGLIFAGPLISFPDGKKASIFHGKLETKEAGPWLTLPG